MSSIRRPKRLIIRGDDERDHPFLVKGSEDLRQDQRIEQLFAVMNILLGHDAACARRGLQLRTYQVIPITARYREEEGGGGRAPSKAAVGYVGPYDFAAPVSPI